MNTRTWTISNILSISRFLLLIPISILLLLNEESYRWYLFGLMIITFLTDSLDGLIARKFNQATELGKILDPLADKTAVIVVCVILAFQGKLPIWFLSVVVVRDVLILLGGVYVKIVTGKILQSNTLGKWTVVVIAFYLVFVIINIQELIWLHELLLILSTAMLFISFLLYSLRFIKTIRVRNYTISI